MHVRFFRPAALACLLALPLLARAAEPATPPTVVLRLQSIDGLLDNVRYLAGLAGREEEAKQLEGMIKARVGAKGLEGIDTKRPLGLYGSLGEQGVDGTAVALVPVADEKALLGLLEQLNLTAEKGDDGVYTVTPDRSPVPIYFRFQHGYAHVTAQNKSAIDKANLLAPAKVLAGDAASVASAVIRLDQIPDNLKQIALTQFDLQLADALEKGKEGETEAQKQARETMTRAIFDRIRTVVTEGGEVKFQVEVDRQAGDLAATLSLAGKPGSGLAKEIAELGKSQSLAAGLVSPKAAVNAVAHVTLPENVRQALEKAIDEGIRQELAKENDAAKRKLAEKFAGSLRQAVDIGELDAGFSFRPSGEQYTLVAALKLKNGQAADAALRDVLKAVPEAERAKIQLDVEKVGGASVHRIDPGEQIDREAQRILGRNPVYLAFRNDALMLAAGPDGLSALKQALVSKPRPSAPLQAEMALGRLANAMARDQKAAPEAARKAFGDKPDSDRIRFRLEGGPALRARLEMKADIIRFLHRIEQAGKGGE